MDTENEKQTAEKIAAEIVIAITDEIPVLTSNRKKVLHKEIVEALRRYGDEQYDEGWNDVLRIALRYVHYDKEREDLRSLRRAPKERGV